MNWFKKKMDIKYDQPFEVTEKQYKALTNAGASNIGCLRKDDDGKYWYKMWLMSEKKFIQKILRDNEA